MVSNWVGATVFWKVIEIALIWLKSIPVSQLKHFYCTIKHRKLSGTPTFECRFMNSKRTFVRRPIILWPSQDITVLFVLFLQPHNEWLEILHQRLDWHFGLAGNQSHGFGPGFTEAHLHHITEEEGIELFYSQAKNDENLLHCTTLLLLELVKTGNDLGSQWFTDPRSFPASLDW